MCTLEPLVGVSIHRLRPALPDTLGGGVRTLAVHRVTSPAEEALAVAATRGIPAEAMAACLMLGHLALRSPPRRPALPQIAADFLYLTLPPNIHVWV